MNPNERDEAFGLFLKELRKSGRLSIGSGTAFDIFRIGILFAEAHAKYGHAKAIEILKESFE